MGVGVGGGTAIGNCQIAMPSSQHTLGEPVAVCLASPTRLMGNDRSCNQLILNPEASVRVQLAGNFYLSLSSMVVLYF